MVNENSNPLPEDPKLENKKQKVDKVVDEIRNVLSGLGSAEPPLALEGQENLLEEKIFNGVPEDNDKFMGIDQRVDQSLESSENPDADFWNGNVLGWPSAEERTDDLRDIGTDAHSGEGLLNGIEDDAPLLAEQKTSAFLPPNLTPSVDRTPATPPPPLSLAPLDDEPPAPKANDSPPIPPLPSEDWTASFQKNSPGPIFNGDHEPPAPSFEPEIPEPPAAPIFQEEPQPKIPSEAHSPSPVIVPNAMTAEAAQSPQGLVNNVSEIPAKKEEPAPSPVLPVPIPGTIQEPPESKKPGGEKLDLGMTKLKPEGLVQVACIFPEGQEQLGQQFVSRLKEAGQKNRKALIVEAVFIQAWTDGQLNFSSWAKTAKLSGADVMFVLAPKSDRELFKRLMSDAPSKELKARFIALEQIELRTLYTDIAVELNRGSQ